MIRGILRLQLQHPHNALEAFNFREQVFSLIFTSVFDLEQFLMEQNGD